MYHLFVAKHIKSFNSAVLDGFPPMASSSKMTVQYRLFVFSFRSKIKLNRDIICTNYHDNYYQARWLLGVVNYNTECTNGSCHFYTWELDNVSAH